uniref:Apoptosis regulatory protein siva n=1 Tax=Corethrella appendiculata TaxID=1370023 RepID=U5EQ68_9DIPT
MVDTLVNIGNNRKRLRSNDSETFLMQRKYFVNEKLINSKSESRMKQIEAKTMSLLFQGAKNFTSNKNNGKNLKCLRLFGNGEFDFEGDVLPSWIPKKPDRKCKKCDKQSSIHFDCINCNLELCEFCGINCFYCKDLICLNCVNIFDSGTIDNPCCENCKMFE